VSAADQASSDQGNPRGHLSQEGSYQVLWHLGDLTIAESACHIFAQPRCPLGVCAGRHIGQVKLRGAAGLGEYRGLEVA